VNPAEYWVVLGVLAAVSGWGFLRGFRWWRWARLIEDTPTSRVRSAAQGHVELVGTARMMPGAPVVAPLSKRTCVWWSFTVERRVRDQRGRKSWRVTHRGVSDGLFYLEDQSGSCVVDPEGAEVLAVARDTWYGETPLPVAGPPAERGFRGFGREYRYREVRIHDGEPMYAIGWFRTETNAPSGPVDADVATLLRQWKRDAAGLMQRFDADRDGMLSLAEWERARESAHEQVRQERSRHAAEPGVHVLERPGHGDRPLLLAVGDAKTLARRYRLRGLAGIGLFLGGTVSLAWLLINAGA